MDYPLVSIIIPTFKRYDTLPRAINSAVNQSYKNIEIIVVDDNVPDSLYRRYTEEIILDRFFNRVNYIKHKKNRNGAAARNTGVRYAKGKYLAFLDDDDEFTNDRIFYLCNKLNELDSHYAGVFSNFIIYDNKGAKIRTSKDYQRVDYLDIKLLKKEFDFGSGSNLLLRKSVFKELRGFDENFDRHQDWEFILRLLIRYKLFYFDRILLNIYFETKVYKYQYKAKKQELNTIQYLQKFENRISQYESNIQKKIFTRHWKPIMSFAFREGQLCLAFKYLIKILKMDYSEVKLKNVTKLFLRSIIVKLVSIIKYN